MLNSEKALFCRDTHDLRLDVAGFTGKLLPFQRKDVGYMFFMQKALNANQTGLGKEQPIYSKVLTPFGWSIIGSLVVGSTVVSSTGGTSIVTGVFPQGIKPVYRVHFYDKTSVDCGEEHLWPVYTNWRWWQRDRLGYEVITCRELIGRMSSNQRCYLPVVPILQFQELEVLIDPYLLGLLLGDGGLSYIDRVTYHTQDNQLKHSVEQLSGCILSKQKGPVDYILLQSHRLRLDLAKLGLLQYTSYDKFVPTCYLFSSIECRLSMLRGLMDTDGSIYKDGTMEFCSSSVQLSEDVAFLVRSLGGCATLSEGESHYTVHAEQYFCGTRYRVRISLNICPFLLERKAKLWKAKYSPTKRIKSVEYLGLMETKCISVSSPDGLYITDGVTLTHNTIEMIALNCLQKQHNRLEAHIQVVPAQSLIQWASEYRKFAPHLIVRIAMGRPVDRICTYNMPFDVLLISYNTLWNDWAYVVSLSYNSIGLDEASFFKNPDTKTAGIVQTLSKRAEWVVPMSATPIQNCIVDLWSVFQVFNLPGLLGTYPYFLNRYTIRETQTLFINRRKKSITKITGYKNLEELKSRIGSMYVRRRVADVEQELPELVTDSRWLELLPEQRAAYDSCRADVLTQRYRGQELRSKFHTLKKIVDGMQTLDPHNPDVSVKANEVMNLLAGDLADEKVVIFSFYKANIRSLSARLHEAGVEHDFIWGDEPDKSIRFAVQERFHKDPSLKVILGTTALEMSLNLQAAKFLIFYDMLYNPQRNIQVIGRIRRLGSQYGSCIVINLLCTGTLEEKMWDKLSQRAAISDFMFSEESGMYDQLTDDELYQIIRG